MASFVSMGQYDATTRIPSFGGLQQYGDDLNTDPRMAVEEKNLCTRGGILQPVAAPTLLPPALSAPIETLTHLYRRWHTGSGDKDILIAAAGGNLYWAYKDSTSWTQLPGGPYQSNVWSTVAYEINPADSDASVDVLLLSNSVDGMIMVRGDTLTVSAVNTPKKYGVIERYAERIWGGAITDDPDELDYSAPFDPTDWAENATIPEDGAGSVNQPSWDGDSFTALRQFGTQLIAFKRNRVWRILGVDPGEYTFKEQFGGGAPYEATIVVDTERIFLLGRDGVGAFDGLSVTPFQQTYTDRIWRDRLNLNALDKACACKWHENLYIALPLDGSSVNNAVLVRDGTDGTWLLREDLKVEAFLATEETLYFTSAEAPGRIYMWNEDSWEGGNPTRDETKWVGPWSDLNYKNYVKGSFEMYLLVEVQDKPVVLDLAIQTDKKVKVKQYIVKPMDDARRLAKQKKIHFGGTGRRFRVMISSPKDSAPWRIVGGMTIVSETDPD